MLVITGLGRERRGGEIGGVERWERGAKRLQTDDVGSKGLEADVIAAVDGIKGK